MLNSDYKALRSTVIVLNNFIQYRHSFLRFLVEMNLSMTANIKHAADTEQRKLLRNSRCLPAGSDSLYLLTVQTDNLSSKLLTQTYQLHYPAATTSFSDTIASCRKTAVVLKMSNIAFAEFLTSTAKI